jgi:hypothetical protein
MNNVHYINKIENRFFIFISKGQYAGNFGKVRTHESPLDEKYSVVLVNELGMVPSDREKIEAKINIQSFILLCPVGNGIEVDLLDSLSSLGVKSWLDLRSKTVRMMKMNLFEEQSKNLKSVDEENNNVESINYVQLPTVVTTENEISNSSESLLNNVGRVDTVEENPCRYVLIQSV